MIIFLDINTAPEISSLTVWDTLKACLWRQIISYTANMKRTAQKERLELSSGIKKIDHQYAQSSNPDILKNRV